MLLVLEAERPGGGAGADGRGSGEDVYTFREKRFEGNGFIQGRKMSELCGNGDPKYSPGRCGGR